MAIHNKLGQAYISGPLTGVKHVATLKTFYENLGAVCNEIGYTAYIPHLHTDPEKRPDIPPSQVYKVDKERVLSSSLVVAYVGIPSIGVGMELAYADSVGIPIVLIYERDRTVSRFPRGIPKVISEIRFDNYEMACKELANILSSRETLSDAPFEFVDKKIGAPLVMSSRVPAGMH